MWTSAVPIVHRRARKDRRRARNKTAAGASANLRADDPTPRDCRRIHVVCIDVAGAVSTAATLRHSGLAMLAVGRMLAAARRADGASASVARNGGCAQRVRAPRTTRKAHHAARSKLHTLTAPSTQNFELDCMRMSCARIIKTAGVGTRTSDSKRALQSSPPPCAALNISEQQHAGPSSVSRPGRCSD